MDRQFNVRIKPATADWIKAEADRRRMDAGTIVEDMTAVYALNDVGRLTRHLTRVLSLRELTDADKKALRQLAGYALVLADG